MSKHEQDEHEQWFREHVASQLEGFDNALEPVVPQVDTLETMVSTHQKAFRKAMWRELLLFWLVVACILLTMGWMAEHNQAWFWGLYALAGSSCFFYFIYRVIGRDNS